MSLKDKLLTPIDMPVENIEVLGGSFPARRVSTAVLNEYDRNQRHHRENMDGEGLNRNAADLILYSLVDEKGERMRDTVSADDLMEVYPPATINAAAHKLLQFNYATLEGVEEAKKD